MFGWTQRIFCLSLPFFLPRGVAVAGDVPTGKGQRYGVPLLCAALTFAIATGLRFLEQPYWNSPTYMLDGEYLLATHDAYHWIAGAEGFEFGTGHPMSELARILGLVFNMPPANAGFWLPPFMGGLFAVALFIWGWGLGFPFAGMCAGVVASLSPGFFARTMLGYYDTDLVVLLFGVLMGLIPALWLTPWLTSVPEAVIDLFRKKHTPAPPGDVALFTTPLPAGVQTPSLWRFGQANSPLSILCLSPEEMRDSMLSRSWVLLLILWGLFGWSTQGWHSLFPYLVRFSALVMPLLILVLGPKGGRPFLLRGALCYAFPLLMGLPGIGVALVYWWIFTSPKGSDDAAQGVLPALRRLAAKNWTLCLLWAAVAALCADAEVLRNMLASFASYANRSGDLASQATALDDPLVFPSVSQSIIEVQTINLQELFIYFYPNILVTIPAFAALAVVLLAVPSLIWFVPLLALSFLSVKMGGRMTMFGAPALLLALCIAGGTFCEQLYYAARKRGGAAASELLALLAVAPLLTFAFLLIRERYADKTALAIVGTLGCAYALQHLHRLYRRASEKGTSICEELRLVPLRMRSTVMHTALCFLCTTACTLTLAWPEVSLIPDYTQGPIINREHAAALKFIKNNTPADSIVWNWWDWGYSTHHFSHRKAIADGARHGGPSLYLPAAVYTTADARFARQLIKYTALKGNDPGDVFEGLSATQAQQLMVDFGNKEKTLIEAPGKQYLVVSFELMRLGVWVTRYGSWNFVRKKGSGALMNNLTMALEYNLETGEISPKGGKVVPAASIDVFTPKELIRNGYQRAVPAYHFVFNPQSKEEVALHKSLSNTPLARFWAKQRGDFSFTATTNDKMSMDEVYYNTLMVQLMICGPDDPRFSPYFKLIFDNVYTRVYEVQ